mgnify:FL=1
MDISLHSFILVVGLVVITFIVWDGIKRVRDSRNNQLDNNIDILDAETSEPAAEYSSADYDELEIADDLLQSDFLSKVVDEKLANDLVDDSALVEIHVAADEKKPQRVAKPQEVPPSKAEPKVDVTQAPVKPLEEIEPLLEDQGAVPVLMEPVELGSEVAPNPPKQHELHLPEFVQQALQDEPITASAGEPDFDPLFSDPLDLVESEGLSAGGQSASAVAPQVVGEKLAQRAAAQEVIVINVLKDDEPLLKGEDLLQVFKACDMRHGEMDIFHRFEQANAQGKIQFSVVNALQPGIFDLDTMEEMSTPGISLFMSLPGPQNPMEAFDAMSEVALVFARNFNASLYDESHSALTPQTLEHYRNRVREFTRKHISINK